MEIAKMEVARTGAGIFDVRVQDESGEVRAAGMVNKEELLAILAACLLGAKIPYVQDIESYKADLRKYKHEPAFNY